MIVVRGLQTVLWGYHTQYGYGIIVYPVYLRIQGILSVTPGGRGPFGRQSWS